MTTSDKTMPGNDIAANDKSPRIGDGALLGSNKDEPVIIHGVVSINIKKNPSGLLQKETTREAKELGMDLKLGMDLELEMLRTTIIDDQISGKPDDGHITEMVASTEHKSNDGWERTWRENVQLTDKMSWPDKIWHMSKYMPVSYSETKESPFPHPSKMTSNFLDWLNLAVTKDQYGSPYNLLRLGPLL
ncbi:hypothetical protein R1flu_002027 [Riccia fluitans]|uniref:Uncharacterized protein n=1 Tax=Riccia fluitans TaxID=41844 RepID=A0ABD1Y4Y5_9MARC